jgi:hypothetical protein
MRDDGAWLEEFAAGRARVRGERGKVEAKDKAPVVGLVDWLKAQAPGAAVWAVGFPVAAKP